MVLKLSFGHINVVKTNYGKFFAVGRGMEDYDLNNLSKRLEEVVLTRSRKLRKK